jgi:hypothetical protein
MELELTLSISDLLIGLQWMETGWTLHWKVTDRARKYSYTLNASRES